MNYSNNSDSNNFKVKVVFPRSRGYTDFSFQYSLCSQGGYFVRSGNNLALEYQYNLAFYASIGKLFYLTLSNFYEEC